MFAMFGLDVNVDVNPILKQKDLACYDANDIGDNCAGMEFACSFKTS